MSIAFAYRAHDSLAIGYPFRDHWHPVFDAPDIGILPIDGTLTYRDYPDACELVPIGVMPDLSSGYVLRSASRCWQDEYR